MKILYFYSEVMGYTLSVVKELVQTHGAEVHIVYWDHKRKTDFGLPAIKGVFYYKRSEMNRQNLMKLINDIEPCILYVSGRMDSDYLKCALFARSKKIITVSGFDTQWSQTLKNYLVVLLASFLYKKYFNFIWVPGFIQCQFAQKLGYDRKPSIKVFIFAHNVSGSPDCNIIKKRR